VLSTKAICTVRNARFIHDEVGTLVTLDFSGLPIKKSVELAHGDPDQEQVLIPAEIGYASQARMYTLMAYLFIRAS
jgi:hypothetical protein